MNENEDVDDDCHTAVYPLISTCGGVYRKLSIVHCVPGVGENGNGNDSGNDSQVGSTVCA